MESQMLPDNRHSINPRLLISAILMVSVAVLFGLRFLDNQSDASTLSQFSSSGYEDILLVSDEPSVCPSLCSDGVVTTQTESPLSESSPPAPSADSTAIVSSPANTSSNPSFNPAAAPGPAVSSSSGSTSLPASSNPSSSNTAPANTLSSPSVSSPSGGNSTGATPTVTSSAALSHNERLNNSTSLNSQGNTLNNKTGTSTVKSNNGSAAGTTSATASSPPTSEGSGLTSGLTGVTLTSVEAGAASAVIRTLRNQATTDSERYILSLLIPYLKSGALSQEEAERFLAAAKAIPHRPEYKQSGNIAVYTGQYLAYIWKRQVALY